MGMLIGTRRALLGGSRPFRGAYDAFESSIVHLYEPARRGLSSYTGNLCRLRRASDNVEADFGWIANGDLNVAAIAAWAGGASNIVTVYDQKTGDAVTQAVAGSQPVYAATAQNGHAGMQFDGTADYLQGAYTIGGALSQPFSVFAVAQLDVSEVNDNGRNALIDGDDSTNRMLAYKLELTTPDQWSIYAGTAAVSGNAGNSNWNIWSILWNGASSQFWHNGISQATGNPGADNADGLIIGADRIGTSWWEGYVNSVIICDPSLSDADRVLMQTAINSYWAVY